MHLPLRIILSVINIMLIVIYLSAGITIVILRKPTLMLIGRRGHYISWSPVYEAIKV